MKLKSLLNVLFLEEGKSIIVMQNDKQLYYDEELERKVISFNYDELLQGYIIEVK